MVKMDRGVLYLMQLELDIVVPYRFDGVDYRDRVR